MLTCMCPLGDFCDDGEPRKGPAAGSGGGGGDNGAAAPAACVEMEALPSLRESLLGVHEPAAGEAAPAGAVEGGVPVASTAAAGR